MKGCVDSRVDGVGERVGGQSRVECVGGGVWWKEWVDCLWRV